MLDNSFSILIVMGELVEGGEKVEVHGKVIASVKDGR